MPTYEMCLLLKTLPKPELGAILKRTANVIFDKTGFIRSIENIGGGDTPYKVSAHGLVHKTSENFLIKFDVGVDKLREIDEILSRDIDVLKKTVFKSAQPKPFECTLHEEILPPAYRKEVIEMIRIAKAKPRNKYTMVFKYNSGLPYYPFAK